MTSLRTRIRRDIFPLWEVTKAEPDYLDPKEIMVKVKKPLPENSRIRIKGNALTSDWHRMAKPHYYIGAANRRFKISHVDTLMCDHLVSVRAKVRVPALEAHHREELGVLRRKKHRERRHHD